MENRCSSAMFVLTLLSLLVTGVKFGDAAQAPGGAPNHQALQEEHNEILQQLNAKVEPKEVSNIITLQASSFFSAQCGAFDNMYLFDRRVVESGSTVLDFPEIPAGHVFVVTSWDWTVSRPNENAVPNRPNRVRTANLYRLRNGGINGPSAQSSALSDADGRAGAYETFPTGIVVRRPGHLCVRVSDHSASEVVQAVVQGFLLPE